jgi:stearoyl-CoA desaturase (Delta-9 desaturase)
MTMARPRPAESASPLGPPERLPGGARQRAERIVRLDRRFALLTQLVPAAATGLAIWLHFHGHPAGVREVVLLVAGYTLVTGAQEIGWHRHFAHHAFGATRGLRLALGILGSMSFQGPLIWWVATHRRHHRFADQPGDPHSPRPRGPGLSGRLRGLYEAHTGWTFDPARARPTGWAEYVKDLYRDEDMFWVHYHYFKWIALGLLVPALIGGLVAGSVAGALLGLLWGGLVRIFVADHCVRALNSVSHAFGTRTFETGELSRNNALLVVPTFGQGWHHNHHAFPNSATTGFAWWQLDPGHWMIRGLAACGLASDVKVPTPGSLAAARRKSRRRSTRIAAESPDHT